MTLSLDTASAGKGSDAGSTSVSWSHTCASSANGLVVAVAGIATGSGNRFATGVTYKSVALSSLTSISLQNTGSGTTNMSELWYLANPATGANTVSITFGNTVRGVGVAASFIGVSGTSTTGAPSATTGNSATASHKTISATGTSDFIVGTACTNDGGNAITLSVTANGQTLSAWTKTGTAGGSAVGGINTGNATGTTSGASILLSTSNPWAFTAVAVLAPAAGGGGSTGTGSYFYFRRRRV